MATIIKEIEVDVSQLNRFAANELSQRRAEPM